MGCMVVYFLLIRGKDFGFWLPDRRIHEQLQSHSLVYTHHAECRMKCRQISENEVKQILQNGEVNFRKSNTRGKPCPSYALEGKTSDGQHVRIVFAACDSITKVITAIDLYAKNDTCQCD
jgi:hypothetical protein